MYKIFDYDLWPYNDGYVVNDIIDTGITVPDNVSKRYFGRRFGLNPNWIDIESSGDESRLFVNYDGYPAFELRKV